MKKLTWQLAVSYNFNIILLSLLYFLGTYFFIGRNLEYMTKTQNQINSQILALVEKSPVEAFRVAQLNNVGLALIDAEGNTKERKLNENILILRLEFGGRLEKQEILLPEGKGKAVLTYFVPYFAGRNTPKFFSAFLRLTLMFIIFAVGFSSATGVATAGLLKADLDKARDYASSLVKGSSYSFESKPRYYEVQSLFNELNALRDITFKREELKKRMTSDLAHELRTPLTTLQAHLEALIEGVWEPTAERFVSCHEEILRLIRLVGDLEKLSKIEDENIVLEKTNFGLKELINSITLNFQGQLKTKGIALTISGEEQDIYADKDKISQVIINLLSNSIKYTNRGGKVLIDLKGDREHVYMVINDSGIGIPTKDINHVFNRFYRSDASRARSTGGYGIGLTIAKSIVEAHRGSIDVVSQEGLGTEITVILPRG
ncbi:multi-sensor signal transduction histidine kinase [Thermincola ferriacetica]|uniref:histidine kinase n=1 Tax=Thermincola ferriacetica TaxID=281456 RepID=A0A0L6W4Q7_9FIRM|nr:ATP-binding protein [Thermincola ferriacetica]KNZ70562.1 multi-sensor signal transduction histidine kinase [Thermincola ferriacetica]